MGVRAGFAEVSADAFEQIIAGGEPCHDPKTEYHSIDKEWHGLNLVLKNRGYPLDRAIVGDFLHPTSPHTYEEFLGDSHEWYFGFMSPSIVQEIHARMNLLTQADLAGWYKEQGLEFGDYENEMVDHMRAAYSHAASRRSGLQIVIA